jgi:hypothetical protein
MMTPARFVRLIGITGLVGWLGMVGWVAKTTLAQQQAVNPPAPLAPSPAPRPLEPARADLKNAAPPIAPAQAAPAAPASAHPAPEPLVPPTVDNTPPPLAADDDLPKHPAPEPKAAPAEPMAEAVAVAGTPDDPEKAAVSFAERSQKEAEEHLKVLTAEAARLNGRLAKVEAAIKQWQNLVNALKSARQQAVAATTAEDEPAGLDPAVDPVRGDRRKWSSRAPAAAAANAVEPPPADEAEAAPAPVPPAAGSVVAPPVAVQPR